MPAIFKKEYNGLTCEIVPTNPLRKGLFRTFPYWSGDSVKLRIVVKHSNPQFNTKLRDLPIRYRYLSGKVEPLYGHTNLPDNEFQWTFESVQLPSSGSLEYWIDNPDDAHSVKLAELNRMWKDQLWLILLSAITGSILTLIVQNLIRLISKG